MALKLNASDLEDDRESITSPPGTVKVADVPVEALLGIEHLSPWYTYDSPQAPYRRLGIEHLSPWYT